MSNLMRAHKHTILVAVASSVILGYSLLLLLAPFLETTHAVQRALQHYSSLPAGKPAAREGEYLLHAALFNVLACLFTLAAAFLPSLQAWKWTNVLGLLGSLLLVASNWIIPLALMNVLTACAKLSLPESFLIFRACGGSWRGGQEDFTGLVRAVVVFGLSVGVAASACTVAYWKERLTHMAKFAIRARNNLHQTQQQSASPHAATQSKLEQAKIV